MARNVQCGLRVRGYRLVREALRDVLLDATQRGSGRGIHPVPYRACAALYSLLLDLGGTYYNTNAQIEALETLLRKLPDPTTPAPPSADRPNRDGHGNSTPTRSKRSSRATRPV